MLLGYFFSQNYVLPYSEYFWATFFPKSMYCAVRNAFELLFPKSMYCRVRNAFGLLFPKIMYCRVRSARESIPNALPGTLFWH